MIIETIKALIIVLFLASVLWALLQFTDTDDSEYERFYDKYRREEDDHGQDG